MSKTLSIFLDLLRFLAAIAVVVDHLGTLSSGWPDMTGVGVAAVAVFFVLSGFVISYVAAQRETDWRYYTVARISRLYSVLVPAIVLSGLVDLVCKVVAPVYRAQWSNQPTNLYFLHAYPVVRFLAQSTLSLTFLNSIHNHDAYPAMNNPVWSMGFEGMYYLLFGFACFSRGWKRWALLAAGCALAGGGILRLLPVWFAGVLLYRMTRHRAMKSSWRFAVGAASLLAAVLLVTVCTGFTAWANEAHGPVLEYMLRGADRATLAYLYYYFGLIAALLILAAVGLEGVLERLLVSIEKPIRWCAGHTFSLYLFHYPLIVLIYGVTRCDVGNRLVQAGTFCAVLLLCMALYPISEAKKLWWRDRTREAMARLLPPQSLEAGR